MRCTATFAIKVDYDDQHTDPDALGEALDRLMETALSTPGILDEYGHVEVGEFEIPLDSCVIVVTGNPFGRGLRAYGPFPDEEAAEAWAECNPVVDLTTAKWWTVELRKGKP